MATGRARQLLQRELGLPLECIQEHPGDPDGQMLRCMVPRAWLSSIAVKGFAIRFDSSHLSADDKLRLSMALQESQTDIDPQSIDVGREAILADWVRVCIRFFPKVTTNKARPTLSTGGLGRDYASVNSFSSYLGIKANEREAIFWDRLNKSLARTHRDGDLDHTTMADIDLKDEDSPATVSSDLLHRFLVRSSQMDVPFAMLLESSKEYTGPLLETSGTKDLSMPSSTFQALLPPLLRSNSNLEHVDVVLESRWAFYAVMPHIHHNLQHALMYSPKVLSASHGRPLFVIYQLIHALRKLHTNGLTHGRLTPRNILLDDSLWVTLVGATSQWSDVTSPERPLGMTGPGDGYSSALRAWVNGWMSNYDYIMALNRLAGRSLTDPAHHPIMPWVVDFTSETSGWRDLTRSKFRLHKGDQQLDFTYGNGVAGEGVVPHHVSDVLSEVTYFVYLARRTSKDLLCQHVRSNWVPEEYPSSMERLYTWTPDECIPAFYTDATIFESNHDDLCHLEVPRWCNGSAEKFIEWHADMLESDHVSAQLHHWIDLNFGYKLSGRAAIAAKNVMLSTIQSKAQLTSSGVVQLFNMPHPTRACSASVADSPYENTLSKETTAGGSGHVGTGRPAVEQKVSPGAEDTSSTRTKSSNISFFGSDSGLSKLFHKKSDTNMGNSTNGSGPSSGPSSSAGNAGISGSGTSAWAVGIDSAAASLNDPAGSGKKSRTPSSSRQGGSVTDDAASSWLSAQGSPGTNVSPKQLSGASTSVMQLPILLPDGYSAESGVQQVELIDTFLQVVLGYPSKQNLSSDAHDVDNISEVPVDRFRLAVAHDMRSLGIIIAEIFLNESLRAWVIRRLVSDDSKLQDNHLTGLFTDYAAALPACIRAGTEKLLQSSPLRRPTAHELLCSSAADTNIAFPGYFPKLYIFYCEFRNQVPERRPDVVRQKLKFIISLPDEGISILMPMLVDLFSMKESRRQALDLFGALGSRLGIANCNKYFRVPILALHEDGGDPTVATKIFSDRIIGSLVERFGMDVYLENFLQFLIDGIVSADDTSSESAVAGLEFIVERLGIVLTSRVIVRPIMRQLTHIRGEYAAQALNIITHKLGPTIFWNICLPHIQTQVESHRERISSKSELFFSNCAHLLRCFLGQLHADELRTRIHDVLNTIIQPVLESLVSVHCVFSVAGRPKLTLQYAELLMCISRAIGREFSREVLLSSLQLFFSAFDWMHSVPLENPAIQARISNRSGTPPAVASSPGSKSLPPAGEGEDLSALSKSFDTKMAAYTYSTFCQLMGQETMRRSLYNSSLVEQRMYEYEEAAGRKVRIPRFSIHTMVTSAFPETMLYDSSMAAAATPENEVTSPTAMEMTQKWHAHFEEQIASKVKVPQFQLRQIHVDTFQGHSSAIRSSSVFGNERFIASGSKDKTVKVWSVSHGSSSNDALRRTYLGHRKTVFEVLHLPRSGHIASCDGSVHLWDPENGYCLRQYEFRRNLSVAAAYMSERHTLVCGTSEGTLKLLDLRVSGSVIEWKPSSSAHHGTIKSLAVDPSGTWVVVGFSTGLVSLLDARTGILLYCWRAHESDVNQLKTMPGQRFLSCSADHTAALWSWGGGDSIVTASARFRGSNDPITACDTYKDELYMVNSNSRLLHYDDYNSVGMPSQTASPAKVKGLRGISTIDVLPMNQLVLFGSDNGTLSLYR